LAVSNKTLVEAGARVSIAAYFDVAASTVSVSAAESRRLNADFRRLPGLWTVDYDFFVPATKVQAISLKVGGITSSPEVFKAAFATELKADLIEAGASADVVDVLVVSDVTAGTTGNAGSGAGTSTDTPTTTIITTTTTTKPVESTSTMTPATHTSTTIAMTRAVSLQKEDEGMSVSLLIFVVLGSGCCLLLPVLGLLFCRCRKKQQRRLCENDPYSSGRGQPHSGMSAENQNSEVEEITDAQGSIEAALESGRNASSTPPCNQEQRDANGSGGNDASADKEAPAIALEIAEPSSLVLEDKQVLVQSDEDLDQECLKDL